MILALAGALGSACSNSSDGAASTATTVVTRNINACSAIDNQVLGRYRKLSVAEQNTAGRDMLKRALGATDPDIVKVAKLLQNAAAAHDLSAMDSYLGDLATRCDQLGIGPEQVAPLTGPRGTAGTSTPPTT